MNILIFAASWYNRGDESAIRAMIDEFKAQYPDVRFKIHFGSMKVNEVPYDDLEIIPGFSNTQRRYFFKRLVYRISVLSHGRLNLMPATRTQTKKENRTALNQFVEAVKWCNLAIYAPSGPNIGDMYRTYTLLDCIDLLRYFKKPYVFFAPSMGPFKAYKKRISRILESADLVCFRENISADYVKNLVPGVDVRVTLDSAFQHAINESACQQQLESYTELAEFIKRYDKVIGITITDLQWHSRYQREEIKTRIKCAFGDFIEYIRHKGYGILFIPQLFGDCNDKEYMRTYVADNCFVVDDEHDCYFQQYLISKLYAVVGMRYHSNIFSAKMGTPFVSVAYEQKMKGFMDKVGLEEYCFSMETLNEENLVMYFEKLEQHYNEYKEKLAKIKEWCQKESYKTTQYIIDLIEKRGLNK